MRNTAGATPQDLRDLYVEERKAGTARCTCPACWNRPLEPTALPLVKFVCSYA